MDQKNITLNKTRFKQIAIHKLFRIRKVKKIILRKTTLKLNALINIESRKWGHQKSIRTS